MGPDYTDHAFIIVGAMIMTAGVVLYFAMELLPQVKADSSVSDAIPVVMSLGLASFTNGYAVGYGMQMHVYMLATLTVVSVVSLIWCIFAMVKLHKAVYSKRQGKAA